MAFTLLLVAILAGADGGESARGRGAVSSKRDGGSAPSAGRFKLLEVPGAIEQVDVPELQQALGVPVRLRAVRTRAKIPELLAHFRLNFARAGLFVPTDEELLAPPPMPQVTGLDVESGTTFSVLLQQNGDGTVTALLGIAYVGDRHPPRTTDDPILLPPEATQVLRSNLGEARVMTFVLPRSEPDARSAVRRALAERGLSEIEPDRFEGGGVELQVWFRPQPSSSTGVVIQHRYSSVGGAERPPAPPGQVDR